MIPGFISLDCHGRPMEAAFILASKCVTACSPYSMISNNKENFQGMKNIQGLKIFFAVLCMVLISGVAVSAQSRSGNCRTTSDASITRSVNAYIRQLQRQNPRSKIRIDVNVKNRTVRLMLRNGPKSAHRSAAGYARSLRCVRKVEVTAPGCSSVGCPKNTYMCNGECVPCIDVCSPKRPG